MQDEEILNRKPLGSKNLKATVIRTKTQTSKPRYRIWIELDIKVPDCRHKRQLVVYSGPGEGLANNIFKQLTQTK
jgi:hypothetical protein